ncbi:MAG: M20/M25/M40 family metallo-hydrolase [Nanoarchaeota archaeon]
MSLIDMLTIPEESIQSHLDAISNIGRDSRGGWTRLAFSPEEQEVHDYAKKILEQEKYSIRTDAFGNLIASKKGTNPNKKRVMLGTHLDTVSNGGNYDGVVGFVTAVESVKLAEAEKGQLDYGIDIVIFRAEESTQFKRACLGSNAAFGFLSQDDIKRLVNNGGVSLEKAVQDNGGDSTKIGSVLLNPDDYRGYFETHIEQASVLETNDSPIGIVTSIRAPERRWFAVMYSVKDAAKIVLDIEKIAEEYADKGDLVATVGKLTSKATYNSLVTGADSINTIPGKITFKLTGWSDNINDSYSKIAERRGVKYSIQRDRNSYVVEVEGVANHSGGTPMGKKYRKDALAAASEMILATPDSIVPDSDNIPLYVDVRSNDEAYRDAVMQDIIKKVGKYCIAISDPTEKSKPIKSLNESLQLALEQSAEQLSIKTMYLPSGAAHDAMKAAQAGIPTAMLFVPSKNGLSHNPAEFTENKYIVDATRVLAYSLMNLK